ncbi:MAG: thioredoxin family protein [Alistipes sp.]
MKDFDKVIWRDALTFVDFFASWCGPCQVMHPVVDKFREQMRGRVDVYKIDIDASEDAEIIHRYNIRSVPTCILFRHGEILWRESGQMTFEHLRNILEEYERKEHLKTN